MKRRSALSAILPGQKEFVGFLCFLFVELIIECFGSEILWEREISGRISVPPVAWRDRVVTVTETGLVTVYNRSGDLIWEKHVETSIVAQPAITRSGNIALSGTFTFVLLNKEGIELARRSVEGPTSGPSISVDGSILIPMVSRHIYVFSEEGELKLRTRLPSFFTTTPIRTPDGGIVARTDAGTLMKLNASGELIWNVPFVGASGSLAINFDDEIFVPNSVNMFLFKNSTGAFIGGYSSDTGLPTSIALSEQRTVITVEAQDFFHIKPQIRCFRSSGEFEWATEVDAGVTGLCIDRLGSAYLGTRTGSFYLVSSNGSITTNLTLATNLTAPVLTWDGDLFIGSEAGKLYRLRADSSLAHSPWPMTHGNPSRESSLETGLQADAGELRIVGRPGSRVAIEHSETLPGAKSDYAEVTLTEEITIITNSPQAGFYRARITN